MSRTPNDLPDFCKAILTLLKNKWIWFTINIIQILCSYTLIYTYNVHNTHNTDYTLLLTFPSLRWPPVDCLVMLVFTTAMPYLFFFLAPSLPITSSLLHFSHNHYTALRELARVPLLRVHLTGKDDLQLFADVCNLIINCACCYDNADVLWCFSTYFRQSNW